VKVTMADARLTFGGALRSEFLKLATLRGMWLVAGASVVLSAIVAGTTSHSQPEVGAEADWTVTTIAGAVVTSWVIVAVFAALQATGEWTSGQFRVSFAVVPRRGLWLTAKAAALGIYAVVVSILVLLVSTALILPRYAEEGATIDWADALTRQVFIGVPVVFLATAVTAVGIGSLVRSSGIAVTAVIGLLVVLPFAGLFGLSWLADITSYLPSGAGDSVVGSGAFGVAAEDLGVLAGLAVTFAWAIVAWGSALVSLNLRDA